MHLGIFAKTFTRPTSAAVFDAVASHGFDLTQFNFSCAGLPNLPKRVEPEMINRIRGEAEARKIQIIAISGTFNMIHPDVEQRREGLRGLGVIAEASRQLRIPYISLCTGTRDPQDMWHHHPDNQLPEAWRDLRRTMEEALSIAQEFDVTLGIEPEVSNVVDSPQNGRLLLDEMKSRHLKIIFDGANLFPAGTLPQMRRILDEAMHLLGPEIAIAHAKDLDHDGEAGHLAAGKGLLDYEHYLGLLQRAGFKGPLLLHGLAESEVDESVGFLRAKLAAINF